MTETTYERLKAPFDRTHKDPRGLDYITGEQCATRLNEVLGPAGWDFAVKDHGYDTESDEIWVLGRLVATLDGTPTAREQFGSQKHNRKRDTNAILDYGFDLKGAATDAMKKCASLIGVGLYLHEKDAAPAVAQPTPIRQAAAPAKPVQAAPVRSYPEVFGNDDDRATLAEVHTAQDENPPLPKAPVCEDCGTGLDDWHKEDGTVVTAAQIAASRQRKFGKVQCGPGNCRRNRDRQTA